MKWRSSYTVIICFLLWLVPFALADMWKWVGLIVSLALVLGVWEVISLKRDGLTLSDSLTNLVRAHPRSGWAIIASMVLGWILLTLVHLPFGI